MRNMKVGFKILLGFGAVLVLLGVVTGIGYLGLGNAKQGFEDYQELARDTNLAGRMQANLLMMRMAMRDYIRKGEQEPLRQFRDYQGKAREFISVAQTEIAKPERMKLVDELEAEFAEYDAAFQQVVAHKDKRNELVTTLNTTGPQMEKKLTAIMRSANEDGDITAAFQAGLAMRNLLLARLYATKFLDTNAVSDAERVHAEFTAMGEALAVLDREVQNPQRRALMTEVADMRREYQDRFETLVQAILARNAVITTKLDVLGPRMAGEAEKVKLSVMAEQEELGPQLQAASAASVTKMLSTGGIALAVGLVLSLLIGRSIANPLKKAAVYATAVAKGDFGRQLDIDSRDEVGQVCAALKSIPATLENVGAAMESQVCAVECGELGNRADADAFPGEFRKLVAGGNTLAQVYTGVLDATPAPVAILAPDLHVHFLNAAACTASGLSLDEAMTRKCSEVFYPEDKNVATFRALENGRTETGESACRPITGEIEVAYAATPLKDRDGKVVAVVKALTDVTQINAAQRQMAETARKATEIADRLASASEELSAQVEEVSQGSELQRDRITETATAMEQMNASVLEVARNSGEAAKSVDESRQSAASGSDVVRQVVEAMDGVNVQSENLKSNMLTLGEQAEAIGQVMNVISDIADQTNLLALNAAIEAARAGEAGRGFAVVADEVRKLAEKTMGATQEVETSIRAIQESTRTNISSTETASQAIGKAVELAGESGEVLKRIVFLAEGNAGQVQEIATASEEQSASSEQISAAVEEVNRIVADTAEGMVQSARAVQELSQMSAELNAVIREMSA